VLDNCSNDGTLDILYKIEDKRLSIYSNEKNIGGILNFNKVLTLGHGIFSMLLLDKDRLLIDNLKDFLVLLETHPETDVGYCRLTYLEGLPVAECYKAGLDAVKHAGYGSRHPSGFFYKTDRYNNLNYLIKEIFAIHGIFGFFPDLINAELAAKGDAMIVNLPKLVDSIAEKKITIRSAGGTYTNPGNLAFFLPHNRIKEYYIYLTHLYTLPLSSHDKFLLTRILFWQGLLSATFGYKLVMKNDILLGHYSVKYKNITLLSLIGLDLYFCGCFLSFKIPLSIMKKIYICLSMHITGIFKMILKRTNRKLVANDK
jgi:hypothetical protein